MSIDTLSPTSRYFHLATAEITLPDGSKVVYIRRRLLPQPGTFALLREHIVRAGERLDNVTAQHLGDPEQFWRICDANGAMRPEDLVQVGGVIRITLPEGVPGPSHA